MVDTAAAADVPIVPVFSGEHNTYQAMLDLMKLRDDAEKAAAVKAAFGENLLDINSAQHADSVMVKPGLAYLDIIWRAKQEFGVPVFAYQVSGEYALIEVGAAAGVGDRDALLMEKLLAFKRAGCSGVLTYHAPRAAQLRRPRPAGAARRTSSLSICGHSMIWRAAAVTVGSHVKFSHHA